MRQFSPGRVILTLVALVCLGTFASCGDNEGRIAFNNLSPKSGPVPTIDVSWETSAPIGHRTHEFELDSKTTHAGPFETAQSGTMTITFALLDGDQLSSTAGDLVLNLKKDWEWQVDFIISDTDPITACFGCIGSRSYDLDPALGYDSSMKLWAVWGGNSIKNPVVY